jgi:polyisoprenoid-binding protein YceI
MTPEQKATSRTVNGVEYPAVGTYAIDVSHTQLGFAVRHMAVSKVRGRFSRSRERSSSPRTRPTPRCR